MSGGFAHSGVCAYVCVCTRDVKENTPVCTPSFGLPACKSRFDKRERGVCVCVCVCVQEGLVRQRGHVWAVDPGVLEPAAHGSNVTRLPMIAQEAVEALHVR